MKPLPIASLVGFTLALFAALAPAQERLEVDGPTPATLRLGDVARVVLRIEGRSADPREFRLPEVPGLELQLSAPTRSSQTFYDGRTLTERVGVQYTLLLRPLREGSFVVPPFPIQTGTREQSTPELRLEVRKDLRGDELGFLDVQVEPRRVYVHEPVRIRVEFGVQQGLRIVEDVYQLQHRYLDIEVQAPWLDQFPGGEKIEAPPPSDQRQLVIVNRTLNYAVADTVERGGAPWRRFVVERAFLPTRLGKLELSAPMLRYHVVLREGARDLFAGNRGRQTDNLYSYGKPIEIEVLPIPEAGRPDPYYGAVGRFALDATVDRSSVQVGQSVQLTLTVRGQGNLEFLSLPELDRLPGFHLLGKKETARSAEHLAVTYDLTPLSADVTAIPEIAWNYFDTTPGVEKFVAVATAAIPLRVAPLANGATLAPLAAPEPKVVTPGVDDIFDLPALGGPPALRPDLPAWVGWLAVVGPALLLAMLRILLLASQRRRGDVAGQRRRGAARRAGQVLAAGGDPAEALAGYLADRLDTTAAAVVRPDLAAELQRRGLDAELAVAVATCLDQGVAARFGGGAPPDRSTVQGLVARLERAGWVVRMGTVLLALLGTLTAQAVPPPLAASPDPAVAAYRAGDYAGAETLFTDQLAATGDQRLWRARGNCLFRLGRLPEALWAYEQARLASPRDVELLANLRLVRQRLGVDEAAVGITAELVALRERFTAGERAALAALLVGMVAAALLFGWRRTGLRWLAGLLALPAALAAAEVLCWGPARPPAAIALQQFSLVAEPREGLAALATVQPGATVLVLGGGEGTYLRLQVGERIGFAPRAAFALVR